MKDKMLKLDVIDRRILYALDRDARAPYASLATEARVSKEVARYRVLQLEKAGAIRKYFTIFDVARLGFTNRKAFIKLRNVDERQERKLLGFLQRHPRVAWLASCDGPYDLAFGMLASDIEQYAEQMADLDDRFGHLFLQRHIVPIVQGQYFHRDYLTSGRVGTARKYSFGSVPKGHKLDELDWDIMLELGLDGRVPIVQIARKTGAGADVISRRLRHLEKTGVVQNQILVLDNAILGQLHYKVLVKLESGAKKRHDQLQAFCRTHPNIIYTVRTFGPWEFEIDLEVPDADAFRDVMRNIKKEFADIIRDYSHVSIYRVHKYNFCPGRPVIQKSRARQQRQDRAGFP